MNELKQLEIVKGYVWKVLPTVYTDALSYSEQIAKVIYQINALIENNNLLPNFIRETVKEYIDGGGIGEIVKDILANYILNVKYPPEGLTPASGDGSTDDTLAIQGCIDYAYEHGSAVYFPSGSYLIGSLTLRSGVSLFGFDRYTTKLVLKSGATKAMISGDTVNCSITRLTLDGNAGVQVNDIDILSLTGGDVLLSELVVKDGHRLLSYNGSGGCLQIDNVVCGNAVQQCAYIGGSSKVQVSNTLFTELSAVGGVNVIEIDSDNGVYEFSSLARCGLCVELSGSNNYVRCVVDGANVPVNNTGDKNNVDVIGKESSNYLSGDKVFVGRNYNETLSGDKVFNSRNYTEELSGNKTTNADSVTEIIKNNKHVEAKSIEEIVLEDKTTTAKNISTVVTGKKSVQAKEYSVKSDDFVVDTVNPITYRKPVAGRSFNTVPMLDTDGNEYNLLVERNDGLVPFSVEYATTNELKESGLSVGSYAHTLGYYKLGDGGSGSYVISNIEGDFSVALSNGNYANLIIVDILNAKQVGCKGDGVTIETELIQKCINWVIKNNRVFYVPGGEYVVDTIYIDTVNGFKMYGDLSINANVKTTKFVYRGTDFCFVIERNDEVKWTYNYHFSNFDVTFKQNAQGGFRIHSINESYFFNVGVWGIPYTVNYGFHLTTPQITKFINCVTSWCTTGFYFHGCDNTNLSHCNIYKSYIAIHVEYALGLFISDNWIEGFKYGVRVSNGEHCGVENLIIENNSFWQSLSENTDARGFGVYSVNESNLLSVRAVVRNNFFYHPIPTGYTFEFWKGDETGKNEIFLENNTVTGVTKSYYNNKELVTNIHDINNTFTDNLFGRDKYYQATSYSEKPMNLYYKTTFTNLGESSVKIPSGYLIEGKTYEVHFSGTTTENIVVYIDDTLFHTVNGTSFDGILKITAIPNDCKVSSIFNTDVGYTAIFGTLKLGVDAEHTIRVVGNNMVLWECEAVVK